MADILGSYLKGREMAGRSLDREEDARTQRLQQTKLMLELIRANAPLKNEDARDLANLDTLNPQQEERLFASLYETHPTTFTQTFQYINQRRMAEKDQADRIQLQNLRNLALQNQAEYKRSLQTPSEEEYQQQFGPLYEQIGMAPPPYSESTYPELNQMYGRAVQTYNAKTTRTGQGQPKPGALDQPIDASLVEAAAKEYGVPVPPDVNTFREYSAWLKPLTKPKVEEPPTPSAQVGAQDEIVDYILATGQPKTKTNNKGQAFSDPEVEALAAEIAARAVARGGNVNANARAIMKEIGWKKGLNGKDAQKILDTLPEERPKVSKEEIRKRIRALKGS
jgi:hypothetical protein